MGSSQGFARNTGIKELEIRIHEKGHSLSLGICDKILTLHFRDLYGESFISNLWINAFYMHNCGDIYKSTSKNDRYELLLNCKGGIPEKCKSVKMRVDTDKWKLSFYFNNKLRGEVDIDENDMYYPIFEYYGGDSTPSHLEIVGYISY